MNWSLASEHIITGIPENNWSLRIPRGRCLDMIPISDSAYCVRVYGIDDLFRGPIAHAETLWCGAPAETWFATRGIRLADAGLAPEMHIHEAAILPVLDKSAR